MSLILNFPFFFALLFSSHRPFRPFSEQTVSSHPQWLCKAAKIHFPLTLIQCILAPFLLYRPVLQVSACGFDTNDWAVTTVSRGKMARICGSNCDRVVWELQCICEGADNSYSRCESASALYMCAWGEEPAVASFILPPEEQRPHMV